MKFEKHDLAYIKITGYGLVSFESFTIARVEGDKVWTNDSEYPFDSTTGNRIWPDDQPDLGLSCALCVTARDIAAGKKYAEEFGT